MYINAFRYSYIMIFSILCFLCFSCDVTESSDIAGDWQSRELIAGKTYEVNIDLNVDGKYQIVYLKNKLEVPELGSFGTWSVDGEVMDESKFKAFSVYFSPDSSLDMNQFSCYFSLINNGYSLVLKGIENNYYDFLYQQITVEEELDV